MPYRPKNSGHVFCIVYRNLTKIADMSGILVKNFKCPEFWHPVNYFSELGHETRMFNFGTKIEKSETDSK